MILTTKTTGLMLGMMAIGGLLTTSALSAVAFADSNTSGDQIIKQLNRARIGQSATNTAVQGGGVSIGSPINGSANTAASSQSASVSQGNTNSGSNNGPTQNNTAFCGIGAAGNIILC